MITLERNVRAGVCLHLCFSKREKDREKETERHTAQDHDMNSEKGKGQKTQPWGTIGVKGRGELP